MPITKSFTNGSATYVLEKVLGTGNFSKCYRAMNAKSKEKVALKVVKTDVSKNLRVFNAETRLLRSLDHENIVKLIDCFEYEDCNAVVVLELCARGTLADYVKRRYTITEAEARYFLFGLVKAVKYLHEHQIVHCDLKSSNVLLTEKLEVKVADFGFAERLQNSRAEFKDRKGTASHMAPELLVLKSSKSYGVDIWALGCILHYCVLGISPYNIVKVHFKKDEIETSDGMKHIDDLNWELKYFDRNQSSSTQEMIRWLLTMEPDLRPSIGEVEKSAFFADYRVPSNLPADCLKFKPMFVAVKTINEKDEEEKCFFNPTKKKGIDMLHHLLEAFQEEASEEEEEDGESCDNLPVSWITRFRRNVKHGISYEVNGTVQYYFNDEAVLAEWSATEMRYYQACEEERFHHNGVPEALAKKMEVFSGGKERLLREPIFGFPSSVRMFNEMQIPRVTRFAETEQFTVFVLSNGVLQIVFKKNETIIFCPWSQTFAQGDLLKNKMNIKEFDEVLYNGFAKDLYTKLDAVYRTLQ